MGTGLGGTRTQSLGHQYYQFISHHHHHRQHKQLIGHKDIANLMNIIVLLGNIQNIISFGSGTGSEKGAREQNDHNHNLGTFFATEKNS